VGRLLASRTAHAGIDRKAIRQGYAGQIQPRPSDRSRAKKKTLQRV